MAAWLAAAMWAAAASAACGSVMSMASKLRVNGGGQSHHRVGIIVSSMAVTAKMAACVANQLAAWLKAANLLA